MTEGPPPSIRARGSPQLSTLHYRQGARGLTVFRGYQRRERRLSRRPFPEPVGL